MKYLVKGYIERMICIEVDASDIDAAVEQVEQKLYLEDGETINIEIHEVESVQ